MTSGLKPEKIDHLFVRDDCSETSTSIPPLSLNPRRTQISRGEYFSEFMDKHPGKVSLLSQDQEKFHILSIHTHGCELH